MLSCPVLRLDGTRPVSLLVEDIVTALRGLQGDAAELLNDGSSRLLTTYTLPNTPSCSSPATILELGR